MAAKKFSGMLFAIALSIALLSGCIGSMEMPDLDGAGYSYSNYSNTSSYSKGMAEELDMMASAPTASDFSQAVDSGERVVIKSGYAEVEVLQGTLEAKLAELKQLIASNNGSVENISYSATESSKSYRLEVRLPPTAFDPISSGLHSIGTLKSLSTSSDDVTFEYMDLEAKIENLEKQKERLLALYDRVETLESIVELESEISRTQYEIDYSVSRKNFIERQAARATLNIRIYEQAPIVDSTLVLPLNEAFNTLIGSLGVGILIISGLLGIAIPFLVALAVLFLAYKVLKRLFPGKIRLKFWKKK